MDPLRDDMSLEDLEDESEYTKLVYSTLDVLSEDYEEQKNLLDERLAELERRISKKQELPTNGANGADDEDEGGESGYHTPFEGPDETDSFSMFPNAASLSIGAGDEQAHTNGDPASIASQSGNKQTSCNGDSTAGYKKRYRLSNGLTRDTASMYGSKRQRVGATSSDSGSSRSRSGSSTSSDPEVNSSWKVRRQENESRCRSRRASSAILGAQRLRELQQSLDDKRRQEREDEQFALQLQGSQNVQEPQRYMTATAVNPKRTI